MQPEEYRLLTLELNGEELEFDKKHASAYQFLGSLACYNHLYLESPNEDGEDSDYYYIFATHSLYSAVLKHMADNRYPMMVNLPSISDNDVRMFELTHYSDVRTEESFPEDWM